MLRCLTLLTVLCAFPAVSRAAWTCESAHNLAENGARLTRGIDWLEKNQDARTGAWPATSLNKERDPASDIGRFMSDAATSYAVMALTPSHESTTRIVR